MDLQNLKSEMFSRIAKLKNMDVADHQIAAAVGVSPEQLEQILTTDEYRKTFSALQIAKYDSHDTLNTGWDAIEEASMGQVLEYLQTRPDPEYALKAAAMANKAQRRGGHTNVPINGNVTAAAVINLNAVFVTKLQAMRETGKGRTFDETAKRVDALDIKQVQQIMATDADDVKTIFANVKREQQTVPIPQPGPVNGSETMRNVG